MLPLAKATVAVVLLYYAVEHWNSWFTASIYIQRDNKKWPLQLVLRQILIINDIALTGKTQADQQANVAESIKYATIVVATVPILAVYPFIQKYFTKGVMIGAVKG
jgi:putative aldouronate transport system permease protein